MTLDRRALLAGAAAVLTAERARAQENSGDPASGVVPRSPAQPPVFETVQPLPRSAPGAELEVIDLWPGLPPGGGGPFRGDYRFDETLGGVITAVTRPCLMVIRPARPNGAAFVVAPGGGYRRIDISGEGLPVGAWLAKAGFTVFLLIYRLPSEKWRDGPDAPRQDAQRAVRLVRANAGQYGLDPERIGLLGFSAGGHLMGETAVDSEVDLYDDVDAADQHSAHVALAGLIYPIITLKAPFDRTISSRAVLVGDNPSDAQRRAYSVDAQVTRRAPPTFLAQAADDPVGTVDHPLRMYDALRAAGVPVEMHLFERGGHGFGLGVPGAPAAAWAGLFLTWIRARGFMRNV
ncbi:MAG: alpha/beta hydrolase [Methylobacterium sp.]